MIRFSKIILFFITTALVAWFLPWFYHFVASAPQDYPFTVYSSVNSHFIQTNYSSDKGVSRTDEIGNTYGEKEIDSLLPMLYYRQLMAEGKLPTQIQGKEITPREIQLENFMFRHTPSNINAALPRLYPLLESMSGRVDLAMPGDVFRMGERIEFIDMASNTVDVQKSARFNEALLDKGFQFPARGIFGNPTTRKEYDEGYFIIDDAYRVFHMKMAKGRPFVRDTGISPDLKMKQVFVSEYPARRFHGFFVDEGGNTYILQSKSYELRKLPLPAFNPEKQDMTIIGNMFDWTVRISGEKGVVWHAVDANNLSALGALEIPAKEGWSEKVAQYLFPFEFSFTSSYDKFAFPRVTDFSPMAWMLNVLLCGTYLVWRRKSLSRSVCPAIALLLFGLFAVPGVRLLQKKN